MKYLPLYYEWMKTGRLPEPGGLCNVLGRPNPNHLELFTPGYYFGGYWGSWGEFSEDPILTQDVDEDMADRLIYAFGPLRQNIVLFLAAMNGEL